MRGRLPIPRAPILAEVKALDHNGLYSTINEISSRLGYSAWILRDLVRGERATRGLKVKGGPRIKAYHQGAAKICRGHKQLPEVGV